MGNELFEHVTNRRLERKAVRLIAMPEQNIAEKIAAIEANGFAVYRDLKCLVALPIAPDEQLFNVTSILESQKCGLNLLNWTQAHNARAFFYDPRAKTIGTAALRQEFQ